MGTKKYEFTDETVVIGRVTLHRIRRKSDGGLGGFIESDKNLSHSGDAWVYGNAWVSGDAQVYGNARVYDDAQVYDNAWVYGNALIKGGE